MHKTIIVSEQINVSPEKAWVLWTDPKHITGWNFASDDWECPHAENDLRVGGTFRFRMSAKDKSTGFDFEGIYDLVELNQQIGYTMSDGRKVNVLFAPDKNGTIITEVFEMEDENSEELQRSGWQAILGNFKKYSESRVS